MLRVDPPLPTPILKTIQVAQDRHSYQWSSLVQERYLFFCIHTDFPIVHPNHLYEAILLHPAQVMARENSLPISRPPSHVDMIKAVFDRMAVTVRYCSGIEETKI
jgi:hypothetical protein